ncbi:hypothetical protein DDB_G0275715 [Dictyostelium discoideum AX4]|uniref:Uncharacterized protein n=1 Tax=Dictyostelium discoideum TaxID=44689 RepID=Q552S5_DICDI|nr:hypothetical protein DDB_G0275715 [Dictyostelium discoideum AX4]EAL69608.1 hypothetical protein DDB_G0275715 [Dictyostelium discoideum AX4]|eukprot:XP_643606.1 hypothetical protein DDB_G0275715 [Dictyostelium discoideum AX4]
MDSFQFNKINEKLKINFLLNPLGFPESYDNYSTITNFIPNNNKNNSNNNNNNINTNIKSIIPKSPKITKFKQKKISLKKEKSQKKIINDQLKIDIKCKKCNCPPSFRHDKKRWWCGKCEKPFTPISFNILTRDNFEKNKK